MEVQQVLCMNGGDGETSYANNSLFQKKVILEVKPMLEESITELYCTTFPECLKIADLGCSSGPNTLLPLWEIVECIGRSCVRLSRKPPMFQVFLNDLPHNDFNSIFRSLGSFYEKLEKEKEKEGGKFGECLSAGMPGSFHKRLFPDHSIHFVHSSYGLHWLSQVPEGLVSESGTPLNKGNIHIAETSPPGVHRAYLNQFERDFTAFLKLRSQEIIPGGRMLLTLLGSEPKHFCKIWELISISLNDLVIEGFVQESKLDRCNIPLYMPTAEEVRDVVRREGSFNLLCLETFRLDWDAHIDDGNKDLVFDRFERAKYVVMGMRAVAEPLLISHFGDGIMDDLFHRFFMKVADDIEAGKDICINHTMSLTKV